MITTASVSSAQLPAALQSRNEDKVQLGDNFIVVLDGASGTDTSVSVGDYVDQLGGALAAILSAHRDMPLRRALFEAISQTARRLDLAPGRSPSSTASVVRWANGLVEMLVLGDSPVYVGRDKPPRPDLMAVTDSRLADLDLPARAKLLKRLANGHGYDAETSRLLSQLSAEKRPYMNRPNGYWIAEANPHAGCNALTETHRSADVAWVALLTDGASDTARELQMDVQLLVDMDDEELTETLRALRRWETVDDPIAERLPRYKQSDDKTIVVVRFQ